MCVSFGFKVKSKHQSFSVCLLLKLSCYLPKDEVVIVGSLLIPSCPWFLQVNYHFFLIQSFLDQKFMDTVKSYAEAGLYMIDCTFILLEERPQLVSNSQRNLVTFPPNSLSRPKLRTWNRLFQTFDLELSKLFLSFLTLPAIFIFPFLNNHS